MEGVGCLCQLCAHLYAEMGVERARRDDERERASKAPGSDGMRFNVCVLRGGLDVCVRG